MRVSLLGVLVLLSAFGCSSSNTVVPADRPEIDAPADIPQDIPVDAQSDVRDVMAVDRPEPTDVRPDTGIDAPADRPDVNDAATDLAVDAARDAVVDVRPDAPADVALDSPTACTTERPCRPFICSCGRCDPSAITCVSDGRGCPLDCLSVCPELDTAVCRCADGVCGPPILATDAGTDAATDAGLPSGAECDTSAQCTSGLLCCYPCGIPGCHNRCLMPMGGRCPLIP